MEAQESQDDALIGHVAIHPGSEQPFCCDEDAMVVIGDEAKLREFVESSTGEPLPEGALKPLHYGDAVSDLMEGGALAFDPVAYDRFITQALLDEFEVPPFDDISVEVEDSDLELGILQLDDEDHDEHDHDD